MALKHDELLYLSGCLGGFFFGTLSAFHLSRLKSEASKAVKHYPVPGLYSGIFALYLQYHGSQKGTNKTRNILLYTLSVLYILSVTTIVLHITEIVILGVS